MSVGAYDIRVVNELVEKESAFLERLNSDHFPLLVGPSRKRFIGAVLDEPRPKARIWGTAAVACRCAHAGVAVVRVHDVRPMAQTLKMAASLW